MNSGVAGTDPLRINANSAGRRRKGKEDKVGQDEHVEAEDDERERFNTANDEDTEERLGWNKRAFIPANLKTRGSCRRERKKSESFANLL